MHAILYFLILISIILVLSILTKNRGVSRIIIINVVCNLLILFIVGFSYQYNQHFLIDLAFLYTLLAPVGAIVFLIYSKFKDPEKRDIEEESQK